MAFLVGLCRHRQLSSVYTQLNYNYSWNWWCHIVYPSSTTRWLSTDSTRTEFPFENAYSILGVPETSSFAEIKASFHKLAKETHPDLAESKNDSSASKRFVQILAAYEILSDSEKRVHYDNYLLSQRKLMQKHPEQGSKLYMYYESHVRTHRQMEAVEWLKWYRLAINDIVSDKKVIVGTGYFDVLQADFYSAIHAAYYGPVIESLEFLPDRFEAEERSVHETREVLHLVSGRDLFGMVRINDNPRLSFACNEKLPTPTSVGLSTCQSMENGSNYPKSDVVNDFRIFRMQTKNITSHESDAYKDLELHVCGRVVAVATRVPPKSRCERIQNEDAQDHIHVFLSSDEGPRQTIGEFSKDSSSDGIDTSRIPLGTITGLGSSPEEGSCFVYDSSGTKTHVIMKHRTLLVKHMHWYSVGEEVSICECRCSRARLPPSKFWLFEARCGMHDIGGWYVETFGRDKTGRTVPSQRYWDGFDACEQFDKRLHPAMYLLALAYRTLDLEDAKRRKWAVRDIIEVQLFRILSWCKKIV